jgi:ABC-type multidrug transport system ATPase subunit
MGAKDKLSVDAVDGLDLEIDENTIFCMLGHNGASRLY